MTYASATPAQRRAIRDNSVKASIATQPAAERGNLQAGEEAKVDAVIAGLQLSLSNAGYAAALPATQAVVANGGNVTVKNSAGTVSKVGVATVAANAISGVALAATEAIVTNAAANVVIQNSAGAAITSAGVAAVAAGVVSNIKLPATIAAVTNGTKQSGWTVTGSGTFFTPTVANGVCTGGVLSAS